MKLIGFGKTDDSDWKLPEEDMTFGGNTLYVDLIPSSCWFSNVRSLVSYADWRIIRNKVISRAEYKCEICGSEEMPLHCHERWDFNDKTQTQTLKRLMCICPACHDTTHFGRSQITGHGKTAIKHLEDVNKWNITETKSHISNAFALWKARSKMEWNLDISIITNAGISVNEIPGSNKREKISHETIKRINKNDDQY
ncbi:hypothetical protein [Ferroplasma acidarmanus]|uniref:HNH endonuclease n=1 Tax=Ferroplasma acidarmanus Fer1 TaxID=333146 RepID=S0AMS2_FERAC|nr:hypothetical protein [Ferroplasma acidarmanus]AGO60578.1 hypothetical protein FACI_IFERC00001G0598 [Ferroplasma acidarmanus Fer1]